MADEDENKRIDIVTEALNTHISATNENWNKLSQILSGLTDQMGTLKDENSKMKSNFHDLSKDISTLESKIDGIAGIIEDKLLNVLTWRIIVIIGVAALMSSRLDVLFGI